MKATKFISTLIGALQKSSIITYNKDFLTFIGLETNSKNIKRLSDYMRRDGNIRDKHFLDLVEEKFGFSSDIWERGSAYQNESIQKAIQILQAVSDTSALDISDMIQVKQTLLPTQVQYLEVFKEVHNKKESEKYIDSFLAKGLLDKKIENQEFLVELIKFSYAKGLYEVISVFLLPSLYVSHRQKTEIQKIEAHTCGSLGNYDEAKHILHQLIHESAIENINLRTSALSNHKRALFAQKDIDADTLYLLVQGYQELHSIGYIYSYYTGINLLYMIVLGQLRFKDDKHFLSINTQKIYEHSKPSLKTDKTHEDYYVSMSNFEFQLLLNRDGIVQKIEYFLENKQPHISLVERTLRQMKLFIHHTQNPQHPIVKKFQSVSALLSDYGKQFDE